MSKLLVSLMAGLFAASVFAADASVPVSSPAPAAAPVMSAPAPESKSVKAGKTPVKAKKRVVTKKHKTTAG